MTENSKTPTAAPGRMLVIGCALIVLIPLLAGLF